MAKPNGHVTQREYAALRGVSRQYISALVRRGVLPVGEGGKLNPSDCDLAMQTIRPRMRPHAGPRPTALERQSYLQARAVSENYKARLLKLEFEKQTGRLCDSDRVVEVATTAFSNCRTRLRSLGKSLAPLLQNRSVAEIVAIIDDA